MQAAPRDREAGAELDGATDGDVAQGEGGHQDAHTPANAHQVPKPADEDGDKSVTGAASEEDKAGSRACTMDTD